MFENHQHAGHAASRRSRTFRLFVWLAAILAPWITWPLVAGLLLRSDGAIVAVLAAYLLCMVAEGACFAWLTRPSAGEMPARIGVLILIALGTLVAPIVLFVYALRHLNWA